MQNHGKNDPKSNTLGSRQAHPSSALGFVNNEQLRNRSSMSKYQTLQKDYAMRSSYSPNPKNFREPSPLSWKVGNSKNSIGAHGGKQKGYSVSKTKSQKSTKTSIKSK